MDMWNEDVGGHRRGGRNFVGQTVLADYASATHRGGAFASAKVTVFGCVNWSQPGSVSTNGRRPSQLEVGWASGVHEVGLPCAGRLQPEHVLKAFEAGADAVCVITCGGENCHYLEGSRRAERRIEYVKRLLDEIGLGGERLMVFHLSSSAEEDATRGHGPHGRWRGTQPNGEEDGSGLAEIGEMVVAGLGALRPNPLRQDGATI